MSVFCPCREPKRLVEQSIPTLLDRDECFHDLNYLLFCSQCSAVRCSWCTLSEPVMWFCSRCLAESSKTDARKAGNHCLRDCAWCPKCHADLKVRGTAEKWHASCRACEYSAFFSKTELSFAKECRNLQRMDFNQISNWVPQHWTNQKSNPVVSLPSTRGPSIGEAPIPLLVPLRAKCAKYCRQCNTILSDPELNASKPKYSVKNLARSMLPHFEAHDTKIMLRSFNKDVMRIRLALYPASSPINLSLLSLEITPVQPVNNVARTGFLAPLSLVERETVASRQAFMANQSNNTSGPGWHCIGIEGATVEQFIYIFASIDVNGQKISVWYRLPTPRGNLTGHQRSSSEPESDSSSPDCKQNQAIRYSSEACQQETVKMDPIFKSVFTPATVLRVSESRKNSANDLTDVSDVNLDVD